MASALFRLVAPIRGGCTSSIGRQLSFTANIANVSRPHTTRSFVTQLDRNSVKKDGLITVAVRNSSAMAAPPAAKATTLWIAERVVSASLVAIVPLAIAFPSKPLDVLMAVSVVAHTYWGGEAIIGEYVRTLLFGSVAPKVAHILLIGVMVTTLGGLFYLIFNDIGLAASIRRLWSIKGKGQT